jgi:hypothetical protein
MTTIVCAGPIEGAPQGGPKGFRGWRMSIDPLYSGQCPPQYGPRYAEGHPPFALGLGPSA